MYFQEIWFEMIWKQDDICYLKRNVGAKLCVMRKRLSLICFMLVINLDVASFAAVNCQDCCYNFKRNSSRQKRRIRISAVKKIVVITCRSSLSRAEGNKRCNKRENMSCRSGGGWYIVQFSLESGTKVRTRHRELFAASCNFLSFLPFSHTFMPLFCRLLARLPFFQTLS